MHDKKLNKILEGTKSNKENPKCTCKEYDGGVSVCKNCKAWYEYLYCADNELWDGS